VREARREDVPALVAMMDEFYAEAAFTLDRAEAHASFETLLSDPRLGSVQLVEDKGEVVGYLVVALVFAMEHGGITAVVDDFFMRPAWRGRGLGTAALAHVRSACLARGVRAMRVEVGHDNAAAQAVYRHNGFATVDHRLMTAVLAVPSRDEPAGEAPDAV
jgi:ribosomal protein S18 acetylase RimI-like enzyme